MTDELTQAITDQDALAVISALQRETEAQLIAFLSSDDIRAKAIKDVTPEIEAYPYGKEGRALFGHSGIITSELYLGTDRKPFKDGGGINGVACFLDVVNAYRGANDPIREQANKLTDGGIERLTAIIDRVPQDQAAIIEKLDGGQWKTKDGEPWPRDHYGLADITEFLPPKDMENWHESRKLKSSDITDHTIAKRGLVSLKDMDLCVDMGALSHLVAIPKGRTEPGGEIVIPYGSLVGLDVAFAFLCNLDAAGYSDRLRELFSEPIEVEAELIPLAQVQTSEQLTNHGFIAKALDGIMAIAYGEPEYTLTPKGGKSKEKYVLRASEKTCSDYLRTGGNADILRGVIDKVVGILADPQSEKYRVGNHLCITVNTICQELLRTKGGTIEARKYEGIRRTVNAALLAATDGRIIATNAAGELKGSIRLLRGEYRDVYKYKKHVYKDVWIFDVTSSDMNEYSESLGHSYRYPLLEMNRPLKDLTEAWIDRYLKDALNELRGKLYKSDGRKSSRKKATVTRSWPQLFEKAKDPTKGTALTSRQKQKLVKEFETILTVLASMDAKGELRADRPLYIKAYSERNTARGKGRGEWKNLVIEATTTLHTPQIDLS